MTQDREDGGKGKVDLFDLRWIIALLMGIFGIVVTVSGFAGKSSTHTAGGDPLEVNVNLWAGIPMILLAVAFAIWAQVRPAVPPPPAEEDEGAQHSGGSAKSEHPDEA